MSLINVKVNNFDFSFGIALVLRLGHATGGARVLIRTCWGLRQRLVRHGLNFSTTWWCTMRLISVEKEWKHVLIPALYLWVSVKRTYHEAVEATNQTWCPEILIQPARGAGMEQVVSRCCGGCVCEPVQEQIGQVLAKIWALKAWLNQPIIQQVQVSK